MAFKRMQYSQVYVSKEYVYIYIGYSMYITRPECTAGRAYSLRSNHWFAKQEGGALRLRIFFSLFTDIKMSTTMRIIQS